MVERTGMIDTQSNIMANMEHAKNRRKNTWKVQSEFRGSETLYEASTIAQEKQIFPKTAS